MPPRGPEGFFPLNDLEALLVRAAGDPAQRPAFARALLEATLYAATPDDDQREGERLLRRGEQVALSMAPLADGTAATAAFTAPERVAQAFGSGTRYLAMRGRDLLELAAANPLMLNPGLEFGVLWSPDDLAAMLGRPVERTIERETGVLLGSPRERPEDLLGRLARAFGPEPEIRAAWLALARWPDRDAFAWYLDVRTLMPRERLALILGQALEGADFRGLPLDLTTRPPGDPEGTGIPVVEPR